MIFFGYLEKILLVLKKKTDGNSDEILL